MEFQNSGQYEESARDLLMEGKPEEALALFQQGLARFPSDASLELGQGMALLDLKKSKEAADVFRALLKRHPDLGDALQGLTEACLAMGNIKEAVAAARQACGPQETDADFVHAVGRCLFRHKLHDEAEHCYRRALELDRAHGYAWLGLAASLHQRGRRDEAICLLRTVIEDRLPGFWEAYSYLGCMLFDAGRVGEAKKYLAKIPLDEICDPSAISRLRSMLDAWDNPERDAILARIETEARRRLAEDRKEKAAAAAHSPDIVAMGDLHGTNEALIGICRYACLFDTGWEWGWLGGDTVVVQTGDVIDRGEDSIKVYHGLERLQSKAQAAGGTFIRLVGNHELMILQGEFWMTNIEKPAEFRAKLISDILAAKVQGAYACQGFLFTHAGVRSQIMARLLSHYQFKKGQDLAPMLAMEINKLLRHAVRTNDYSHPIFQVGVSRGGPHEIGGAFWESRDNLFASVGARAVRQVFGHTPGQGIVLSPSAGHADIDAGMVFGGPISYLRIRKGKFHPRVVGKSLRGGDLMARLPKPTPQEPKEDPDKPDPAMRDKFWHSFPSLVTCPQAGLALEAFFSRVFARPWFPDAAEEPVFKVKVDAAICEQSLAKLADFLEAYPWVDHVGQEPIRCWRVAGVRSLLSHCLAIMGKAKKHLNVRKLPSYGRLGKVVAWLGGTLREDNGIFPIWMLLWFETGVLPAEPEQPSRIVRADGKTTLTVRWQRLPRLHRLGHGVAIYHDRVPGTAVAFIEGFGWHHGRASAATVRLLMPFPGIPVRIIPAELANPDIRGYPPRHSAEAIKAAVLAEDHPAEWVKIILAAKALVERILAENRLTQDDGMVRSIVNG